MSESKLVPVVDKKELHPWKLNKEQAEAVGNESCGSGCMAWAFFALATIWTAATVYFADLGALLTWGPPFVMFCLMLYYAIKQAVGKTAYLHRCAGRGGALDVQVLGRRAQFYCSHCLVGRKRDDGSDDPHLAVIALSGWYGKSSKPTRLKGMRLHPSEFRFVSAYDPDYGGRQEEDRSDVPMYASMNFVIRARSRWRSEECSRVSLEEIMATRQDLAAYRIFADDIVCGDILRLTRQAEGMRELLIEVHSMILATSRFGASKGAAAIRERITKELAKIYDCDYPAPWIEEMRGASPKRTAKKK